MTAASRPPMAIGIAGTTLAHGLLIGGILLAAHRAPEPLMVVYAVNLTAAPRPTETPTRTVAPPAPPKDVAPARKKAPPKKAPVKKTPAPTEKETARTTVTKPPVAPLPDETPGTGVDQLTFQQPGLQFPYPQYLENIVTQIRMRFTEIGWAPGLKADIAFTIRRDGSVYGVSFLSRSNSYAFNKAAEGAVQAAVNDRAFGPLPQGWPGQELPIAFSFTPKRPQ